MNSIFPSLIEGIYYLDIRCKYVYIIKMINVVFITTYKLSTEVEKPRDLTSVRTSLWLLTEKDIIYI